MNSDMEGKMQSVYDGGEVTAAGHRYWPVSGNETGFRADLAAVINRYSRENGSNTPDFILADYLTGCLNAFDAATRARTDYNQPGISARTETPLE